MMEKYNPDWALMTDLYQLTMTAGYIKTGKIREKTTFNLFFRKLPPNWGFCVFTGLERIVSYLLNLRFTGKQIDYLRKSPIFSGKDIYEKNFNNFFEYLRYFRFTGDVYGIPEGELIFPNEPILSVVAPLPEAQIVETFLLQTVNFQTLIASKAARICLAAGEDPVLEFGARRAQGFDGALSASRAAYIGGCAATSNVLAGQKYGIPVAGTHAHSWVMSFEDELKAFEKYADVFPNDTILLVDTTNTLRGVKNATIIASRIEREGHEIRGIRLDSGNLLNLSKKSHKILEKKGFPNITIVASGDLDEYEIASLKASGAKINGWGVGTKLATSFDYPALGGVYKLAEIEGIPKMKIAGEKTTNPCRQNIWRSLYRDSDIIDHSRNKTPYNRTKLYQLLTEKIIKNGKLIYKLPEIEEIKNNAKENLEYLSKEHKRLKNPKKYPVHLSPELQKIKNQLLNK